MQKMKKAIFPVLIMVAISLMLSTTNCATNRKIEYVYDIHDVVFPLFPAPEAVTFDEKTETVSMPLWYWQKIAEYKIEVDAIEAYFDKINKLQTAKEK